MSTGRLAVWIGFTLLILGLLALDLGVFQRRPHVIGVREALAWFVGWLGLAIVFNVGLAILHERGLEAGLEFLAGFFVEKSLSIDNVFVFLLIFNYFRVPAAYQHKVLFWGIIGAIALRLTFILGGLALLARFHWMFYAFGGFLVVTGMGLMRRKERRYDPEKNLVLRAFRRFVPISEGYDEDRFFTRGNGLRATPLIVVLIAIESSDIVFAADSIPAIFAITRDPFIIYTSNIFAMLGLRALYFAVAGFMGMFHLLHYGFASIILILGIKMLLSEVVEVPVVASLLMIIIILLICVIVSLLRPRKPDVKPMLERTERLGLIPLRRLLLIENVLDFGDIAVRDALCPAANVAVIRLDRPWWENVEVIRRTRYSRYPLVERPTDRPIGLVHVKDILFAGRGMPPDRDRLKALARPFFVLSQNAPLDEALRRFQTRAAKMAVVVDGDRGWLGILTLEDVLEELVGRVEDEYDAPRGGQTFTLADALAAHRIILGLEAESLRDAVYQLAARLTPKELAGGRESVVAAALRDGERAHRRVYLGEGVAIPRARLDRIDRPLLAFGRSDEGVPLEYGRERAELIFLLLTPKRMPRLQPRLFGDLADLVESEYVMKRLRRAETPEEVIDLIREAEQIAVD